MEVSTWTTVLKAKKVRKSGQKDKFAIIILKNSCIKLKVKCIFKIFILLVIK